MTALAIIVTTADRADAALRLALAAAALGRPVALLFDSASVSVLAAAAPHPHLADALAMGVRLTACQTGLADCGLAATALLPGVTTGGMVGFLADHAAAQLLLA